MAPSGTAGDERDKTSWPDLLDVRRRCNLCEAVFVTSITGSTLSIGERAQVITGSIVSANYFDAIGVHPVMGRGFEPGEDTGRNAHPVVFHPAHRAAESEGFITCCDNSTDDWPVGKAAENLLAQIEELRRMVTGNKSATASMKSSRSTKGEGQAAFPSSFASLCRWYK